MMRTLRTALAIALPLLGACDRAARRAAARDAESSLAAAQSDSLLRSADGVAVYNAGVDAYRAKDYARARRFWRRADELGARDAASNLGFLLYFGYGGPPDSLEAALLWRRAISRGDVEAHRHVAQAIVDGDERLGTLADAYGHAVAARRLALRPGELGDEAIARSAEELMTRISPRLSAPEREAAQRMGEQWASEVTRR